LRFPHLVSLKKLAVVHRVFYLDAMPEALPRVTEGGNLVSVLEHTVHVHGSEEEEEQIYICSSRLGLIKMDHHHSGNGRNSQQ
jgi:hypothetical protein